MYIINWLSDFDIIKYPVTYYVNKATIGAKLSLSLNIWFRFLFLSLNWLTEYHWNKFVTHSAAEQDRWERCGCTKIPMNHTQYKKPGCKSISFCRQFHLHLAIKNYNAPTPHLLQKSATSLSRSMLCSHLSITVSIPNGDNFHSNCNLSCHKWWYLNVRNKIKVQL